MRCCRILAVLAATGIASGCADPPSEPESSAAAPGGKADGIDEPLPEHRPRRVILMIGDGMGAGSVSAAAYASEAGLNMMTMPRVSFMTTHEHEFVTTDSAASATALATGIKTHFEGVGVLPGTTEDDEADAQRHLFTLLDAASQADWRTGVITTASIVDATPAAFTAHRAKRRSRDEIAEDIRHSGVDVILGGGRERFDERDDGQNLINQMRNDGYSTASTATGLRRHSGSKTRVVGLLHDGDMPPVTTGDRAMPLSEMVSEAIEILDTENPDGYVLVVEGAQIDRRGHELDGPGNVAETIDFDAAVGVALQYARGRDDTLVVVTADHETGGVTVLDRAAADPMVEALGGRDDALALGDFPGGGGPEAFAEVQSGAFGVDGDALVVTHGDLSTASRPFFFGPSQFYRATHSPAMVPLFVEGPAAEFVGRSRDNAELGARLLALVAADEDDEGEPTPAVDDEDPQNLVLVLADGVGLPALTAAHYASGTQVAETMTVRGLASTHASDRILGDAASAAVAWSSGQAGTRGGLELEAASLLRRAADSGRASGLVSTASALDPGLVPFFGGDADEPARSLVQFDAIDVVFTGGSAAFDDALLEQWSAAGADIGLAWDPNLAGADGPAIRLVAEEGLPSAADRLADGGPTLDEMTATALQRLAEDDDGFVLVVYAPGAAQRAADMTFDVSLMAELAELDGAVEAALDFAEGRDDTLVVVSSMQDASLSVLDNHYGFHRGQCGVAERCGGPETLFDFAVALGQFVAGAGFEDAQLQGEFADLQVILQGAWLPFRAQAAGGPVEPHSANLVPVFAQGPGSDRFGGAHHQSELGEALAELLP